MNVSTDPPHQFLSEAILEQSDSFKKLFAFLVLECGLVGLLFAFICLSAVQEADKVREQSHTWSDVSVISGLEECSDSCTVR